MKQEMKIQISQNLSQNLSAEIIAYIEGLETFNTISQDVKAEQIHNANKEKGFWDEYYDALDIQKIVSVSVAKKFGKSLERTFISEKLMLMVTEVAELMEAMRKPEKPDEHCNTFSNREIELADIFIRCYDLTPIITKRLGEAISAKLEYNKSRPFKHGKGM